MGESKTKVIDGGSGMRFVLGDQPHEYVDVTLQRDYADGKMKVHVLGGTAKGINVQPKSGNFVVVGLQ